VFGVNMKSKKIIASIYPFPFFIGVGHNTNFSLIKDKKIFSLEEGKLATVVNSSCDRFPEKSMLSGFKYFNIEPKDVDHWVFGGYGKTPKKPALEFFFSKFKAINYQELNKRKAISFVKHHDAHASLAIYGSGLKEGLFICLDDGGDEVHPFDTYWGTFKKNKLKTIGSYNRGGWGICRFHNFICESIGYLGNVDNGKVMGLAPYGKVDKSLYKELRNLLIISKDGFSAKFLLRHNPIKSKPRYEKLFLDSYQFYKVIHSPNPPKELTQITKFYSSLDIAATGQKVVEDVTFEIIKNMLTHTKQKNIVCSGGFFQNIAFNKKLLELGLNAAYIPSAPNDSGLSLGGALNKKMSLDKSRPKSILSPFLGVEFSSDEVIKILDEFNLVYKKTNNISKETAKLISKGKVVGWFQGRSELGPRSLGARSVLADPRKYNNKAKLNQLLKKRDWFMPFAPSVLYDKMEYFYKTKIDCPYMSFALNVNKNNHMIPAAVHVDKSSRPHTIKKESFPLYYNLIKEFYKITGVPAILNTSFNRHGIATIQTCRQAVEHLLNGCIEILAIDSFIVFPKKKLRKIDKKIDPEEHYIVLEKLKHLLDAIKNKDKEYKKILQKNKTNTLFKKYKIVIKNKNLFINKKKVDFLDTKRETLRSIIFPRLHN
jgi:carbamoyltransferase